jgi:hypothetical protein
MAIFIGIGSISIKLATKTSHACLLVLSSILVVSAGFNYGIGDIHTGGYLLLLGGASGALTIWLAAR